MKQTGVEYLVEQLFPKALSEEQYYHIEQAKAMEKEQIKEAYCMGDDNIGADDYYNETFKQKQ